MHDGGFARDDDGRVFRSHSLCCIPLKPEIPAIFAAFQQGEIRFDGLEAALGHSLTDNPERVPGNQAALRSAKIDGLPWHVCAVPRAIDLIAEDGEFGPGQMPRKRIQFWKKLGECGMGAVWRGRDVHKVRAHDRNPYVVIKLLN